jgi:hypothetical protein
MVNKEYDIIRKIILKNFLIDHNMGGFVVNPAVVKQLEEHFRQKFDSEKLSNISSSWDDKVWEPFKLDE